MSDLFEKGQEYENQGDYVNAFIAYLQAAEAGDADAQFNVACMYCDGEGVERNSTEAIKWYTLAAEQGNANAQLLLGRIYDNGYGVERNLDKACTWYKRASDQGCAAAQYALALMYIGGVGGLKKDNIIGKRLMIQAAEAGYNYAQFYLALMYENGFDVDKNYYMAAEWYRKAAESGHDHAQVRLGLLYYKGLGVQQDYKEAAKWFRESTERGNNEGQWHLGYMYEFGQGVEENLKEAVKWYAESARQGNSVGQWRLGYMYYFGKGVDENPKEAVKWYAESAKQGNGEGQWRLGCMYRDGKGVEKNLEEAAKWYIASAEQGNSIGQWFLGCIYYHGEGVSKKIEESAKWFRASAEQGNSEAANDLGCMYAVGEGVEQNYNLAKCWYEKAAASGNAYALCNLGDLYQNGFGVDQSFEKAASYWKQACESAEDICNVAPYQLAYAYYDGLGVEQNLEKAKEYFELAFKNGYNCSYAIDMVKYELANREINKKSAQESGDNLMRQYAEHIIKKKNFFATLPTRVSKDLEKDFADTWQMLDKKTRESLVSAVIGYVVNYSYGPSVYGNLDFSQTINGICKALEIELGKILYTGYIQYLIDQNIDPNSFPKNRSLLKQISRQECTYRKLKDVSKFTLGDIKHIVGLDKEMLIIESHVNGDGEITTPVKAKNKIDKTMIEYMRYICKDDAFGDIEEDRAITDYLVYFTQEIGSIAESLRNPAAHANIMKCEKAEVCGNYIIKVKKILKHFLDKIDVNKLKALKDK